MLYLCINKKIKIMEDLNLEYEIDEFFFNDKDIDYDNILMDLEEVNEVIEELEK